jgi:hypothetical protein
VGFLDHPPLGMEQLPLVALTSVPPLLRAALTALLLELATVLAILAALAAAGLL